MVALNENMRIPPQSLEAEQALLGAILSNNKAMEKVSDFLRAEHFANPVHGKIYEAAQHFIERGRIADPITLKEIFDSNDALKEVGGSAYLAKLRPLPPRLSMPEIMASKFLIAISAGN